MVKYIARKMFAVLTVLFVVSFVTFFIIHLTPGDPARVMLGADASEEAVENLREQMGLNRPLPVQYVEWLGNVLRGNLGDSIFMKGSMTSIIGLRMKPTVELTVFALVIAVFIAIPTGILAARGRGRLVDQGMMAVSMLGVSVPNFLLGLLLVLLFAVKLKLFPASGYKELQEAGLLEHLRYLLLPAVSLGLMHAALLSRMTRSAVLEVLNKDYIKMAKAKGVRAFSLMFRHALRNALIPVITVIAQSFVSLLAGALVTETVFNIPGIGKLVIDSISRRDYEVVQAMVLLIAVVNVLIMFLLDILYGIIDPRIRSGK
ncbi:MAG: ABC transporter permease [Lachnospiraceae bacterium]|jgi:peptide/nickel transport system permease protein|nr:ABC transporter permease [Lachnospiraceae bacterium]